MIGTFLVTKEADFISILAIFEHREEKKGKKII